MYEAVLYEKLSNKRVSCNICQRKCTISDGERGWCLTRINREGKLYSLIYGRVSTIMVSPIEKKPVFHFYPASKWLSIGSVGCNFRCPGCQNSEIAHDKLNNIDSRTEFIVAESLLKIAKEKGCKGISWTYNEPTLWFEYTLDGAKLAKRENLSTNYATNGFITTEALELIGPYLDVFRVDIKGFSNNSYRRIARINDFTGILKVTEFAKKKHNTGI
ncbi:MAG TPA: radical SAM protein [Candidatus Omnitrophica bacterium]|nr:radical SAM protein [Candidatus Omnitrophota bacterium]